MKYLFMLFLINNIYAVDGSYIDTQQLHDFRSTIVFDDLNSSGSSGNTLGEDRVRDLGIGDYLQIDNKEKYVLKTVSRHLIVDDFKLVNKFKVINKKIKIIRKDLEETLEEYTTDDILHNLDTTIKPFEVDDF